MPPPYAVPTPWLLCPTPTGLQFGELETHATQLAELRRALRAYDLAGPETASRKLALGEVLTLARQLTEE